MGSFVEVIGVICEIVWMFMFISSVIQPVKITGYIKSHKRISSILMVLSIIGCLYFNLHLVIGDR